MYYRDYDRDDYLYARAHFQKLNLSKEDLAELETPPFDSQGRDPLALQKALVDHFNFAEQKFLGLGCPAHGSIPDGIYWCARDVNNIIAQAFNHHFVLIVNNSQKGSTVPWFKHDNGEVGAWLTSEIELEGVQHSTTYITLGGFYSGIESGKLEFRLNDKADVGSTIEHTEGEPYHWWWNLGFENKPVAPNPTSHQDSFLACARAYHEYAGELPEYRATSQNCSTWANSVCLHAGISDEVRSEAREFPQIDLAADVELDGHYFGKG